MLAEVEATNRTDIDLAREGLYRFLSAALTDPQSERFDLMLDRSHRAWLVEAVELLRHEAGVQAGRHGFGELPAEELRLEATFAEVDRGRDSLQEDFNRVFGMTMPRECPPYETEFLANSEPFFRSQQMADIAGFYRAFGLELRHTSPERPDHIALELEFMAFLLMKKRLAAAEMECAVEHVAVCGQAERDFFREHLATWLPAFGTGLRSKAETGFYAAIARVLAALLPVERARFGVAPARMPLQAVVEEPEDQATCAACSLAG